MSSARSERKEARHVKAGDVVRPVSVHIEQWPTFVRVMHVHDWGCGYRDISPNAREAWTVRDDDVFEVAPTEANI